MQFKIDNITHDKEKACMVTEIHVDNALRQIVSFMFENNHRDGTITREYITGQSEDIIKELENEIRKCQR